MKTTKHTPSTELKNDMEVDHYDSARDFFENRGANSHNLNLAVGMFESYDEHVEDVLKDMADNDMSEAYLEHAKSFSSKRATDIIKAAYSDHQEEDPSEPIGSDWTQAK